MSSVWIPQIPSPCNSFKHVTFMINLFTEKMFLGPASGELSLILQLHDVDIPVTNGSYRSRFDSLHSILHQESSGSRISLSCYEERSFFFTYFFLQTAVFAATD